MINRQQGRRVELVLAEPGGLNAGLDHVVDEVAHLRRLGVVRAVLQQAVDRKLAVHTQIDQLNRKQSFLLNSLFCRYTSIKK